MLSGNISRNTVPSMNPAPSAIKYRSDLRPHLLEVTISPPMTLANAARRAKSRDRVSGFITSRSSAETLEASSRVPDRHDVAVFDGIFLAFQAEKSFFFEGLHAAVLYELIV